MFDYDLKHPQYSPWMQLAILLMLGAAGFLIGAFVTLGIAHAYLDVPLEKLSEAFKNSGDANLSRLLQFVNTFFVMAAPSFVYARVMDRHAFEYIGFNSSVSGKQVFIIVGIVFIGLMVSGMLSQVNDMIPLTKSAENYFKALEDQYNKQMMVIANMKSVQDYVISLFMIALLPAVFEEMLFRGALQPVIINITTNAFIGILLTSILFSAIHGSFYGFLPRLAMGLIIGYIFYFSRNLWLASITHFLYNGFGVTQMYALSRKGLLTSEAMNEDPFSPYYGLFAAGALYILFIFFKKESDAVIAMHNPDRNDKEDRV